MFCPKCATQNLDGASFCRSCGANISLISNALSGQLPQANADSDQDGANCAISGRKRGEAGLDHALRNIFMGVAFVLVSMALAFSRMGRGWWMYMLIPAFSLMGTGVAQYIKHKDKEKQSFRPGNFQQPQMQQQMQPQMQPQRSADVFPVRNTGELVAPPPSVTEGTTRHLGAEMPTRHFDKSN